MVVLPCEATNEESSKQSYSFSKQLLCKHLNNVGKICCHIVLFFIVVLNFTFGNFTINLIQSFTACLLLVIGKQFYIVKKCFLNTTWIVIMQFDMILYLTIQLCVIHLQKSRKYEEVHFPFFY